MSIHVERADGVRLKLSAWSWGTAHELVAALRVVDDTTWDLARGGGGVEISETEARAVAAALREHVLTCLEPGERMTMHGLVTSVPDDGTLHRDDLVANYAIDRDTLVSLIEHLGAAGGPVRFW